MATKTLEEQFHEEMIGVYKNTGRETGYWARRYLQKVKRVGGLQVAHDLLKPAKDSAKGLQILMEKNRIDLSVEALVMRQPWSSLFASEELEVAQKRLMYTASLHLPEEVLESKQLLEGSVCQVTVNKYERNSKARKKCIEYYGTSCCVCSFNFGEVYGTEAENFIHVHHLNPLSDIGEEYKVNPIKDLRPVCPNCHAMIHLGGKTRSIKDVKTMIKRSPVPEPKLHPKPTQ